MTVKRMIVPWLVVLCVALVSPSLLAAQVSGTVYSGGSPVANLAIQVKETGAVVTTGTKGEYTLTLQPGSYTLVVRGREFPVKVAADPVRLDIQL
jgi:hypothetical protein